MLTLSDIMTLAVVTVHVDDTLERLRDIFESSRFHHLIVLDEGGTVAGLISDRDLLKHVSPFIGRAHMERGQDINTLKRRAHQIMSRRPICASPDTPVAEAACRLLKEDVTCLPVVDGQRRVLGIVSWRDLLSYCYDCQAESTTDHHAA